MQKIICDTINFSYLLNMMCGCFKVISYRSQLQSITMFNDFDLIYCVSKKCVNTQNIIHANSIC